MTDRPDHMNLDEALAILAHFDRGRGMSDHERPIVDRACDIVRHYAEDAMKREITNVGERAAKED